MRDLILMGLSKDATLAWYWKKNIWKLLSPICKLAVIWLSTEVRPFGYYNFICRVRPVRKLILIGSLNIFLQPSIVNYLYIYIFRSLKGITCIYICILNSTFKVCRNIESTLDSTLPVLCTHFSRNYTPDIVVSRRISQNKMAGLKSDLRTIY